MNSSSPQMLNFLIKCYLSPSHCHQYLKDFVSVLIKKRYYFPPFNFLLVWNITLDTQFLLLIVYHPEVFTHHSPQQANRKLRKGYCRETEEEACVELKPQGRYVMGTSWTNCLQKSKQSKQKDQQPPLKRSPCWEMLSGLYRPWHWRAGAITSFYKNQASF